MKMLLYGSSVDNPWTLGDDTQLIIPPCAMESYKRLIELCCSSSVTFAVIVIVLHSILKEYNLTPPKPVVASLSEQAELKKMKLKDLSPGLQIQLSTK